MIQKLLRAGLGSLLLGLILSCGGGSDAGSGSGPVGGAGGSASVGEVAAGSGTEGSTGGSTGGTSSTGDGSTSTAGNSTGDASGVGSGGTGVSTADAGTSVGSVDGMGSIFVGGLRYDIEKAIVDLRDATELQIGMTVAVTGPVDATFANGTALQVLSMAQMRGQVDSVDVPGGSFQLLGSTVSVDDNTVWADLPGLTGLAAGARVQVWALPVSAGVLRATRIESQGVASTSLVTGMLTQLGANTFQLGGLVVDYQSASLPPGGLANNRIVRVAALLPPVAGRLEASQIEADYALSSVQGAPVQLEGVITDYASQANFQLKGVSVDASAVQPVTGGPPDRLGNGVKVVASGTLSSSGVLVASKLKIRHIPGGGALPSFDIRGIVGNYVSPADFMVKGQRVDASNASIGGQLVNGAKVRVQGTQVVNNVLLATQLTFE